MIVEGNGNVYRIANHRDTSRSQTFTYDPLNRLLSAQNAGADCTQILPDGHAEYWGNSYVYDDQGNLNQTFTYDPLNRLLSAQNAGADSKMISRSTVANACV